MKKLTLVQLLITPMERIIRYDALLKALRRQLCVASGKTPSDELTDSDLDRAYATIHKIAVGGMCVVLVVAGNDRSEFSCVEQPSGGANWGRTWQLS